VPKSEIAKHAAEVAEFAEAVAGAEVNFTSLKYSELLASWHDSPNRDAQNHAATIAKRFDI
jgi:hypothetical protein